MKKTLITAFVLFLVSVFCFLPLMSKNHDFRLGEDAKLCGVQLTKGQYNLTLSEDVAGIYKGNKLLVTAKVKVSPLEGEIAHSYRCKNGEVLEVRLEHEKVIFIEKIENITAKD